LALLQAQGSLGSVGLAASQQSAMISRMIDQQTFTLAATEISFASTIIYLLLILVVWRMKVGRNPQPARPVPGDKPSPPAVGGEARAAAT
ncbi:MAG: hypothetical protein NTV19_19850, partial [Burkholderiales bacterium]|nr:hypothetical protein [Burkholderiales bacterium]